MKIHHNTTKKARKYGIALTVVENEIVASHDGVTLASGMQGNIVLEQAIAKLNGNGAALPAAPGGKRAKLIQAFRSDEDGEIEDNDDGNPGDEEIEDEGDEEIEDDGDEGEQGASIVKAKYKAQYRPTHYRCGDDLAERITAHVTLTNSETGEDYMDVALLKRFAKANDCWQESYLRLNNGQMRMNVGNRLRAKVKKGYEVVWD